LNTDAQVRIEINASCGAAANVAVLNGAYEILIIKTSEKNWQLVDKFAYFRRLVVDSGRGLAISCDRRYGVVSTVVEFLTPAFRSCGSSGIGSGRNLAFEKIVKRETNHLLVIPITC
jgi:hypothetical protein